MIEKKEMKIEFAPGCFDGFDGTQEELDQLIQDITQMVHNGELLENSQLIDINELMDSEDPDDQQLLDKLIHSDRNLQ